MWLLGACVIGGGHALVAEGYVCGCWGACVVAGGVHGCWGCAWLWRACMVAGGVCMVAGGCASLLRDAWLWGACMVMRGVCGCGGCAWLLGCTWLQRVGACIGYDKIQSMSGQYTSYWNAFLFSYDNYKIVHCNLIVTDEQDEC